MAGLLGNDFTVLLKTEATVTGSLAPGPETISLGSIKSSGSVVENFNIIIQCISLTISM
jgi:hypothetical protein